MDCNTEMNDSIISADLTILRNIFAEMVFIFENDIFENDNFFQLNSVFR